MVQKDGSRIPLDTDNSWRVLPAPTWDRNVPRASFAIMWMEIYDARKEPVGWMKPGFDDAGWQKPVLLGKHPVDPWQRVVPRGIPPLLEEEWFPTAILDQGTVSAASENAQLDVYDLFGFTEGLVV